MHYTSERLHLGGAIPHLHSQTASPSGSSPTTLRSLHSGSTHHDPGVTTPGLDVTPLTYTNTLTCMLVMFCILIPTHHTNTVFDMPVFLATRASICVQ